MIYTEYTRPTAEQYEAIGRIAAHWSFVEFELERLLIRLAQAPDFPGLALTNDLSIDNRLKALKNLADMNARRYSPARIPDEMKETIDQLAKEIACRKDGRNRFVHYIWLRQSDDKMFGTKFKGRQARGTDEGSYLLSSNSELMTLADELEGLANRIQNIADLLPEIQEAPERFQPQEGNPRHLDNQ